MLKSYLGTEKEKLIHFVLIYCYWFILFFSVRRIFPEDVNSKKGSHRIVRSSLKAANQLQLKVEQ